LMGPRLQSFKRPLQKTMSRPVAMVKPTLHKVEDPKEKTSLINSKPSEPEKLEEVEMEESKMVEQVDPKKEDPKEKTNLINSKPSEPEKLEAVKMEETKMVEQIDPEKQCQDCKKMFKSKTSVKNHKKSFRCPVNRFATIKPKLTESKDTQEKSNIKEEYKNIVPKEDEANEAEMETNEPNTKIEEHQIKEDTTINVVKKQENNEKIMLRAKCEKCEKTFKNIWVLKRHLTETRCTADEDNMPTCQACGKQFSCSSNMTKHLKLERCKPNDHFKDVSGGSHEQKLPIPIIEQNDENQEPAERDSVMASNPKCNKCGSQFSNDKTLRLHIQELHAETKSFKRACSQCSAEFTRANSLKKHLERKACHLTKCGKCDKNVSKRILKRHISSNCKVFSRYSQLDCKECNTKFSNIFRLNQHMKAECNKEHQNSETELNCPTSPVNQNTDQLDCKNCGTEFTKADLLQKHLIGKSCHLRKCEKCEKNVFQGNLKRHNCKLDCKKCGKEFFKYFNLKRHMKSKCKDVIETLPEGPSEAKPEPTRPFSPSEDLLEELINEIPESPKLPVKFEFEEALMTVTDLIGSPGGRVAVVRPPGGILRPPSLPGALARLALLAPGLVRGRATIPAVAGAVGAPEELVEAWLQALHMSLLP